MKRKPDLMQPEVRYDRKSDILYIAGREGEEEEFVEVAPGVSVELDEKGEVIGIEIMNASKTLRSFAKAAMAGKAA